MQFNVQQSLNQVVQRLQQCQNRLHLKHSAPQKTSQDQFFFIFDREIFSASTRLIIQLFYSSLPRKKSWPQELKSAFQTTLKELNLSKESLLFALCKDQKARERFAYVFSVAYLDKEPMEWMRQKFDCLSQKEIKYLFQTMRASPEERSEKLYEWMKAKWTFPYDLILFKSWSVSRWRNCK